ncbi:MAG: hypothetical protein ACRCYY_17470 [Trueperaceae bacterium]
MRQLITHKLEDDHNLDCSRHDPINFLNRQDDLHCLAEPTLERSVKVVYFRIGEPTPEGDAVFLWLQSQDRTKADLKKAFREAEAEVLEDLQLETLKRAKGFERK